MSVSVVRNEKGEIVNAVADYDDDEVEILYHAGVSRPSSWSVARGRPTRAAAAARVKRR
jgi:hypothetical protein